MIGIYLGKESDSKGWLPKDAYICQEDYINCIPDKYGYPNYLVIDKINKNEEGYFKFNKGMIDIGSELGEFSLNTNFSKYYLFDGNNKKCVMASANMLIRGKDSICNVYNTLLSDKNEDIIYDGFLTTYSIMSDNSIPQRDFGNNGVPSLHKAVTLDSFNINNIGFIKIDVEGMEEKVLRGGIETIKRNNYPPILFELWDVGYMGMTQERHDSLENFLTKLGYKILWYWGDFENHLAVHI